jgi:hypothetical protein
MMPSQPTEGRIAIVMGSVSRQGLPTSIVVGLLPGARARTQCCRSRWDPRVFVYTLLNSAPQKNSCAE